MLLDNLSQFDVEAEVHIVMTRTEVDKEGISNAIELGTAALKGVVPAGQRETFSSVTAVDQEPHHYSTKIVDVRRKQQ